MGNVATNASTCTENATLSRQPCLQWGSLVWGSLQYMTTVCPASARCLQAQVPACAAVITAFR